MLELYHIPMSNLNNGATGVCHIVHQDGNLPPSVPDQHHACHLQLDVAKHLNKTQMIVDLTSFAFFLSLWMRAKSMLSL